MSLQISRKLGDTIINASEDVDFTAQRELDKTQLLGLADCSFVQKKENPLIVGPTGVGKSYIASALGHQACLQ